MAAGFLGFVRSVKFAGWRGMAASRYSALERVVQVEGCTLVRDK